MASLFHSVNSTLAGVWVENSQEVGKLRRPCTTCWQQWKNKILLSKLYFKAMAQQLCQKLWRRKTVKVLGSEWGEKQGLVLFLFLKKNWLFFMYLTCSRILGCSTRELQYSLWHEDLLLIAGACGLSCGIWDLVSQPGMEPRHPVLGVLPTG